MMNQNLIETRSLAEQVYQHLCDRIIEGGIFYGQTLNIKQIAAELRVSSMPVREAIKRLQMEGIVRIKPRSTCVVRVPTRGLIRDALAMRELIENHCVETIFPNVTSAELRPLGAILDEMKAVVERGQGLDEIRAYVRLDRRFHEELCRLASNELMSKFYRETSLHLTMNFIYDIAIPPDIVKTLGDHRRLYDALLRNSPKALDTIREHLLVSRRNVLSGKLSTSLETAGAGTA